MNLFKASLSIAAVTLGCGGGGGGGGDECAGNFVAGDLVITEVMANPDGQDEGNEYWEIFNPGSAPVDVTGLALFAARPDGSDEDVHIMRAATIAPGQYFVVGGVLDEFKAGHVNYGYANDLGSLRNAGGRLGLRCKGTLVDEIEYGEAADGIALELDGSQAPDAIRNDEIANFCNATNQFLPDNFGTPQEANGFCTIVAPGMCNDGGTMRETVKPAVGDVVITEMMPNPEVAADADGEWFEVLALADFDLNGLNAGTEAGNPRAQVDSPDCIPVTAGQHILFARGLDETVNGGLPAPDAVFSFSLTNTDGSLAIGLGEETLDVVTWAGSSSGVAINLGVRNNDPVANDAATAFCDATTPYNAEVGGNGPDLGTPQAANGFCVAANECIDADTGEPRATVTPNMGEISISEWMANPVAVDDTNGEYVEVLFDVAADANGLQLGSDAGAVASTVDNPDCVPVLANTVVVFVRDTSEATNGGIPNAVAATGFAMTNTGDRIFVGFGDVEFDAIEDTGNHSTVTGNDGAPGVSAQIDGNGATCDTPAGNTYGDGDTGTPGDVNPDC